MLSNLINQLHDLGLDDKYDEVLAEVPRVRAELGYPPLVTPLSQMVGTQALMNVVTGERYKVVSNEIRDYVRGMYGRPPVKISRAIREQIIGEEEPITCRPADLILPSWEPCGKRFPAMRALRRMCSATRSFPSRRATSSAGARTRSTTYLCRRSPSRWTWRSGRPLDLLPAVLT